MEDAPTGLLPVQDAPTGVLPVVPRAGSGDPDPLTAPFSDIEDALVRRTDEPETADPPESAEPPEPSPEAPPENRRSGPVTDRPWPPPAASDPEPRQEDR